jgi:hypothetical protein
MRFSDMRKMLSDIELEATKRVKGESRALIRASQTSRKASDFNDPAEAALSLLKNMYGVCRKWVLLPYYKDNGNEVEPSAHFMLTIPGISTAGGIDNIMV